MRFFLLIYSGDLRPTFQVSNKNPGYWEDRNQVWLPLGKRAESIGKVHEETFSGDGVQVAQVYTFVKFIKPCISDLCILPYIVYISKGEKKIRKKIPAIIFA